MLNLIFGFYTEERNKIIISNNKVIYQLVNSQMLHRGGISPFFTGLISPVGSALITNGAELVIVILATVVNKRKDGC